MAPHSKSRQNSNYCHPLSVISVTVDYRLCRLGSMDSTTVGQVCSMAEQGPLLVGAAALEKTFILQRQKTLMRMVAMCWGRFSGVINKVCRKQRGTESL